MHTHSCDQNHYIRIQSTYRCSSVLLDWCYPHHGRVEDISNQDVHDGLCLWCRLVQEVTLERSELLELFGVLVNLVNDLQCKHVCKGPRRIKAGEGLQAIK